MAYLIECPFCKAVMGAEVKAEAIDPPEDEFPIDARISLCICPRCSSVLIGREQENFDGGYDSPVRVWPSPPKYLSFKIPKEIRSSLIEAERCLRGQAYTATVAMSGRALEAVGRHFYPPKSANEPPLMLKQAIDRLATDQIIDGRLHKWGLALHSDRNLAAHPSGASFKEGDARDVFKFAMNICEYIFVLSDEFEDFEKRRGDRISEKPANTQANAGGDGSQGCRAADGAPKSSSNPP